MDQILPRLWLGDFVDAEAVTAAQCACVLSLCEKAPALQVGVDHRHRPLTDEVCLSAHVWAHLVFELRSLLYCYRSVLVQCRLGKSRAPALVTAYLTACGWTLEAALALVTERRALVQIHPETWRGVTEWWRGAAG